jgi:hypothetical protein
LNQHGCQRAAYTWPRPRHQQPASLDGINQPTSKELAAVESKSVESQQVGG